MGTKKIDGNLEINGKLSVEGSAILNDSEITTKKDFKTINGESIIGEGNIIISTDIDPNLRSNFNVQCPHTMEYTSYGYGEGACTLAANDQQMLVTKIQGQTRTVSPNLFDQSTCLVAAGLIAESGNIYRCDIPRDLSGNKLWENTTNITGSLKIIYDAKTASGAAGLAVLAKYTDGSSDNMFIDKGLSDFKTFSGLTDPTKTVQYISVAWSAASNKTWFKNFAIYADTSLSSYIPYNTTAFSNASNSLISTGRNLIKWSTLTKGIYLDYTSNVMVQLDTHAETDFIVVRGGTNYYFMNSNGVPTHICYYDYNKDFIGGSLSVTNFTTPINACYMRLTVALADENIARLFYGSEDLGFEPYIEDKLEINEELGQFDYIDVLGNKMVKQTSPILTLTGNENWVISKTADSYPNVYRFDLTGFISEDPAFTTEAPRGFIVSNRGQSTQTGEFAELTNLTLCFQQNSKTLYLLVPKKLIGTDPSVYIVSSLRTWLQGTGGIKFVYKLANPVITEFTSLSQGIAVYKGGMQLQIGDVPYVLTKTYGISIVDQTLNNIEIDRGQQLRLNALNTKVSTLINNALCKDENNNYIATECSIMDDGTTNTAVFGLNSVVSGVASFASGYLCEALGNGSTAFGYKSKAEGTGSVAEGAAIESGGTTELADFTVDVLSKLGNGSISFSTSGSWAYGTASHVEGVQTVASGHGAHAEGMHTIAIGDYSHTEGNYSIAEGTTSHAEGSGTWAAGMWSHAEGEETQALHNGAHAEGCGAIASGPGSHAEGCGYYGGTSEVTAKIVKLDAVANINDWIFYNHVFIEDGEENIYFTNLEHYILVPGTEIWNSNNQKVGTVYNAFNSSNIPQLNGYPGIVFTAADFSASTNFSTASTYTFKIPAKGAQGEASHTGGYESIALGDFSRSGGYHNLTLGQSSTAFGSNNTVIGSDAMAIGYSNVVGGVESFALGGNNILEAVGEASVVAGWYNKLSNGGTIITGSYNDVSAGNSIVVGNHNLINGSDSGAIGVGLKLMDGYGQLVCGKYNVVNPDAMFIVADGDDDTTRRNVFQVTVDGDAVVENNVCCKDVQCETINGGTPCTYSWDANSGTLTLL